VCKRENLVFGGANVGFVSESHGIRLFGCEKVGFDVSEAMQTVWVWKSELNVSESQRNHLFQVAKFGFSESLQKQSVWVLKCVILSARFERQQNVVM
jgi:hypothetical protein